MKYFAYILIVLTVSSCSSPPGSAAGAEITPPMWVARLAWEDHDARSEAWKKLKSMGAPVIQLLEDAASPGLDGTKKDLLRREAFSLLIELNPEAYLTENRLSGIILDESQPQGVRKLATLAYKRSFSTEFSTQGPRFIEQLKARLTYPEIQGEREWRAQQSEMFKAKRQAHFIGQTKKEEEIDKLIKEDAAKHPEFNVRQPEKPGDRMFFLWLKSVVDREDVLVFAPDASSIEAERKERLSN